MALGDRLRILFGVLTFLLVGCVVYRNHELISSAPKSETHGIVKRHVKREIAEERDVARKPRVCTKFTLFEKPTLYQIGDQQSRQPSAKCPIVIPSLDPCSCRSLARGIVVECSEPQNVNELSGALSELRDYIMSETKLTGLEFKLHNSDLDQIETMSLQFLRGNVVIEGAEGSFSFAEAPLTKRDLKSVHFLSCTVDLGVTTLAAAPSVLNALEFLEATLENYRPEWLKGLRVDQLWILDSKEIKLPLAADLKGLKVYKHSKCDLQSLSEEYIPKDRSQLRRLDFSMNSLSELPGRIFEGIPNLEEVLLISNRFTSLDAAVFKPVMGFTSIQRVDVNGNFNLECTKMSWLSEVPTDIRRKLKGSCVDEYGVDVNFLDLES
ncbi:uncharacterized protein LOC100903302 [Galendromus occidentalis]|uniref:Uncharacterized protein LOC100903302 n=1 Tax=Galendromus occidentalis TaxID=34638 RepID=A0AAJ6VVX0_9ACAR|nr:uncharacterized protein LOC100903302 [Galendromus occidentalis]